MRNFITEHEQDKRYNETLAIQKTQIKIAKEQKQFNKIITIATILLALSSVFSILIKIDQILLFDPNIEVSQVNKTAYIMMAMILGLILLYLIFQAGKTLNKK